MANRRMVSKNVVESDPFLDMPAESQALYTHLMLNTDDDGFIDNPGSIRRMTGFSEDSFKLLIAKGFLIGFPNGVVAIAHWEMQNKIQPTRKVGTVHLDELDMLTIDKQGKYIFLDELSENCRQRADELPTNCQQIADELPTNAGQDETAADEENQAKQRSGANYQKIAGQMPTDCRHRLGKDRLSKVNLGKDNLDKNRLPKDGEEVANLFNDICKSYKTVENHLDYSGQISKCIALGYTLNDFKAAFINAEKSDLLKGLKGEHPYQSNFGWILEHLEEVKNGKYN